MEQNNFDSYEVTRMSAAPRVIRAHIVPGDFSKPLGGVGEPGVPPIPPAICNGIFAATGKRIRRLPIRDQLRAWAFPRRGGRGEGRRPLAAPHPGPSLANGSEPVVD